MIEHRAGVNAAHLAEIIENPGLGDKIHLATVAISHNNKLSSYLSSGASES